MTDMTPADERLLAEIEERRKDSEFMERLRRMIEDDRDVLDRLRDGDEEK